MAIKILFVAIVAVGLLAMGPSFRVCAAPGQGVWALQVQPVASTGTPLGARRMRRVERKGSQKLFRSAEQVVRWINDYHLEPAPQRMPDAIRALSRFGAFEDLDEAGLYVGFLAGVLGDNQLQARALIRRLFPMRPKAQAVIIMGIAYSGLPEWRTLLGDFAERMPQRTVLIDEFLSGKRKPLQEAALDQSPHIIDALWGYYIATGYLQPVGRIIEALGWSNDRQHTERFSLARMAMWTLAANAERDRPLLRFYRAQLVHGSRAVRAPLKKVIHAGERFEASRMKKQVIAAIAAQKRHKPGKFARYARPARLGEALLSVGCVAASALGHAELAAPCIVTGAIYSGVRKLMFEK